MRLSRSIMEDFERETVLQEEVYHCWSKDKVDTR